MARKFAFNPDFIVPPGATLKETLDAIGLSQTDLSIRTGLTEKTISQIVNGVAPISYETAGKLELATGVAASFWNRRELSYRQALARKEDLQKLQADVEWLQEIPLKELVDRGHVPQTDDKADSVWEALRFFGVSSVASWRNAWTKPLVQYRGKSARQRHPGYVAAWLRLGELQAADAASAPFDAREFRRALAEVREMTVKPVRFWNDHLPEVCARAGVVVVFTKEIPRAGISGATKWLTKDKALIQLSLKYKTADQLWFTFFHEAGHILLHGKRQVFLEFGKADDNDDEHEANAFARDILIPPDNCLRLASLRSKVQIKQFARSINIEPGIVVGRLQKEGILRPSYCNDLKKRLAWS